MSINVGFKLQGAGHDELHISYNSKLTGFVTSLLSRGRLALNLNDPLHDVIAQAMQSPSVMRKIKDRLELELEYILKYIPFRTGKLADTILLGLTDNMSQKTFPSFAIELKTGYSLPKDRPTIIQHPQHEAGEGEGEPYVAIHPLVASRVVRVGELFVLNDPLARSDYISMVRDAIVKVFKDLLRDAYESKMIFTFVFAGEILGSTSKTLAALGQSTDDPYLVSDIMHSP